MAYKTSTVAIPISSHPYQRRPPACPSGVSALGCSGVVGAAGDGVSSGAAGWVSAGWVLSGSLPPGCPADYYRTLIETVEGLGCRCILDADGEPMRYGLESRPFMIKPNRAELERMAGRELTTLQDVRAAALKYIDQGVAVVAVSLGADGALITDGDETLFAPKLTLELKSTVGAGDSMVAGLACGFIGDNELEEAFRMGVACASARCTRLHSDW